MRRKFIIYTKRAFASVEIYGPYETIFISISTLLIQKHGLGLEMPCGLKG